MENKLNNEDVIVYDTCDKYNLEGCNNLFEMRENVQNILWELDSPLVSIILVGYNNLEKYTKKCVESVLEYTKNIDYELILVDNGSSDGTIDYFKLVKYENKRIIRITENKGAFYGSIKGHNIARGKYIVGLPNDVFVTTNWLHNMIRCMESEKNIGMVCTMSDNISNMQQVKLTFNNFDEMQVEAKKFNKSDPRKWSERLRLVGPIGCYKKECLDMVGFTDYGFAHNFGDDDLSFRIRRAGYKVVLCGDVFVQHAGSVITGKDPIKQQLDMNIGRANFKDKYYGIDAWDDANNFESEMISIIEVDKDLIRKKNIKILGIDVKCGTPILEIKNKLRYSKIFNTILYAFTTEEKYWLDLNSICKGNVYSDRIEYLDERFNDEKFDYILVGDAINTYKNPYKVIDKLVKLLGEKGQLIIKLKNKKDIISFFEGMDIDLSSDNYTIHNNIDLYKLSEYLYEKGYSIDKFTAEKHYVSDKLYNNAFDVINSIDIIECKNEFLDRLLINNYALKIIKRK